VNILEQVLVTLEEEDDRPSCPQLECHGCKFNYPAGCIAVEIPTVRKVVEWVLKTSVPFKAERPEEIAYRMYQLAAALKEG
jgi:hypothetical protein